MSLNTALFASDLAFMVGELPDQIVMDQPDGRTFACVAGMSSRSRKLADEGLLPLLALEVTVQSSLLVDGVGNVALLTERQRFTFTRNGLKYRIDKISDTPDGAGFVFEANQVLA